jgi:Uma2 family endonuclease
MMTSAIANPARQSVLAPEPLLEQGDQLTRDEFERRYGRMPHVKKAELIEGTVYMPSPVRARRHGKPHNLLGTWLGTYASETEGVECFDNSSVRLDLENEPQPDLILMKLPDRGGQARLSQDDYIEGAPELAVEIAGSSASYDLHQKKRAYLRNGIREYLVWIIDEGRVVWWELKHGNYQEIRADDRGLLKSGIFPGLWLDMPALLQGNLKAALACLRRGMKSPEHRQTTTRQPGTRSKVA